jgi:hypothetical protein
MTNEKVESLLIGAIRRQTHDRFGGDIADSHLAGSR